MNERRNFWWVTKLFWFYLSQEQISSHIGQTDFMDRPLSVGSVVILTTEVFIDECFSIVSENNMLNVVLGSLMNQFQKDHPCEIKYIT